MDLVSIAPATKTVALNGAAVEVTGLSLRKLTQLIVAYPDLVGIFVGGKTEIATLIGQAPDAALAVFSLGVVGKTKRLFWKRAAPLISDGQDNLIVEFEAAPAGQQIEILGAIFDLTFKGGERALPFLTAALRPAENKPQETPTETPAASMPASSSG